MIYLVDANVFSEVSKPTPNPNVIDWLASQESNLVVDPIILGELSIGILALPIGRKRSSLEQWFETIVERVECVPWDALVSRQWAMLVTQLQKSGRTLPILDSMIAATALAHGFAIATRNVRDFRAAGVKVFNPFA